MLLLKVGNNQLENVDMIPESTTQTHSISAYCNYGPNNVSETPLTQHDLPYPNDRVLNSRNRCSLYFLLYPLTSCLLLFFLFGFFFFFAKNDQMNGRSPARVLIQNLQDLLVGPTCSGLDERQNTTSAVQVVFFLSHGEGGARMESDWGRWGCTAQSPTNKSSQFREKGKKRIKEERREEKRRGREIRKRNCPKLY